MCLHVNLFSGSDLRRRPSGIGFGMSRDSESLSLATALIESVRRLAARVRHASAAAARREGGTPPAPPAENVEVRLVGARDRVGLLLLVFVKPREREIERENDGQNERTALRRCCSAIPPPPSPPLTTAAPTWVPLRSPCGARLAPLGRL